MKIDKLIAEEKESHAAWARAELARGVLKKDIEGMSKVITDKMIDANIKSFMFGPYTVRSDGFKIEFLEDGVEHISLKTKHELLKELTT